jgi:hypothetical protein
MKKSLMSLLLFIIGSLLLEAQTPFLYTTKRNIVFEANAYAGDMNFPAEMDQKSNNGRFNIISNTNWRIDCSQPWLTVVIQEYFVENGKSYVYNPHSGSAPDIGAYEFYEIYATGNDTAFVLLMAEPNGTASRTAIVTISGTGITNQIINIFQRGTEFLEKNTPPTIETNLIIGELETPQETVFE